MDASDPVLRTPPGGWHTDPALGARRLRGNQPSIPYDQRRTLLHRDTPRGCLRSWRIGSRDALLSTFADLLERRRRRESHRRLSREPHWVVHRVDAVDDGGNRSHARAVPTSCSCSSIGSPVGTPYCRSRGVSVAAVPAPIDFGVRPAGLCAWAMPLKALPRKEALAVELIKGDC